MIYILFNRIRRVMQFGFRFIIKNIYLYFKENIMRRKKFLQGLIFAVAFATAFFITACSGVDSGSDPSSNPTIYGTWKTTNKVTLSIDGNCSQEILAGSTLVLNEDKTFSINFNGGYFRWPSGGGTSGAPHKETFNGSYTFYSSHDAIIFSFTDSSSATTYKFGITYPELSFDSVTLNCEVLTTKDSKDENNFCILHCDRK